MSEETEKDIDTLFNNFKEFLKEKNRRYGNSAISPIKIFSRTDTEEQISNRIDDKLNRIKSAKNQRKMM